MTGKQNEYICFCHLESKSRNLVVVKLLYFQIDLDKPSYFPFIIKTFKSLVEELSKEQNFEILDESIHKFLTVKTVTKNHRIISTYQILQNQVTKGSQNQQFIQIVDEDLSSLNFFSFRLQTKLINLMKGMNAHLLTSWNNIKDLQHPCLRFLKEKRMIIEDRVIVYYIIFELHYTTLNSRNRIAGLGKLQEAETALDSCKGMVLVDNHFLRPIILEVSYFILPNQLK